MTQFCVNDGEPLTKPCQETGCLHYYAKSQIHCVQHLYNRPLTLLDVAHLEGRTFPDGRRIQRLAENKIIAWGKILEGVEKLRPAPFVKLLEAVYDRDEALALQCVQDIGLLIAPPMQYLKSELWFPILQQFHLLMAEAGIATVKNKTVWNSLIAHHIL